MAMTPDVTAQAWLEILCRFITGVESAVVLLGTPAQGYEPVAQWPPAQNRSAPSEQSATKQDLTAPDPSSTHSPESAANGQLCEFAASMLQQQHPSISVRQSPCGYQLSSPIMVAGRCFGAACLQLASANTAELERVKQLLVWGNEWFAWLARERKNQREQDGRLLGFVKVMALALKSNDFDKSAKSVVDALAERTACSRVSLALNPAEGLRLKACSDVAVPSQLGRSEALIVNAMGEAESQAATVSLPSPAQGLISTAHQRLLKGHAVAGVCSIPMVHEAEVVGVLTFEGCTAQAFDVRFVEQVALLLGAVFKLQLQASAQPSLLARFKPFTGLKRFAALAAVAGVIALAVLQGEHQVVAKTTVLSENKQILSALQDGYLQSVQVRPGDTVSAGQALATFDDRDLQLEYQKWQGKKRQFTKSYNHALGQQDRGAMNIHRAQVAQAEAELALLNNQLARSRLVAPFDGVVVAGDWSQSLGAPVKRGEVIFEIARAGEHRLQLAVDERDVAYLAVDQAGAVRLASLPDQSFNLRIARITPVAFADAGNNFFEVEASLDTPNAMVNAGMTGVAKVVVGERSYLWLFTHRVWETVTRWWWAL